MITVESVIESLKSKGSEKTQITYSRHGMPMDRTFGVSTADMKAIQKTIKGQQELAYELFETGMMEAMYIAGLVADGSKMTRERLDSWAEGAAGLPMISESTVPWVACEHSEAAKIATGWMRSENVFVATSGWCTYSGLLATVPDSALDLTEIERLLGTVEAEISGAKNRVKYTMNGFVISVGTYVVPLVDQAKASANRIGVVSVDMGDTACEVRLATAAIAKVEMANKVGQKRKTMRC